MKLNIPKSTTVSHELPIFTELSRDSGLPVSEIKARFRKEMLDKYQELLDDPSSQVIEGEVQDLAHNAVNSLRRKLAHPEEETDDDEEYDSMMGIDGSDQAPGADMFAAPDEFGGGDMGGGFGGDMGGGFGGGGGIDNMSLGFSDEGMSSFDEVNDSFSDFGSEATGDSVNAMSEIEPGGNDTDEETETEPLDLGGSEETAEESAGGSDDLVEF